MRAVINPGPAPYADEPGCSALGGAELAERLLADLDLARRLPLVTVDAGSTPDRCFVTLYDRGHPGFTYEATVTGTGDALRWIAHVASKTWVTKEHLELVAVFALGHFVPDGGRCGSNPHD